MVGATLDVTAPFPGQPTLPFRARREEGAVRGAQRRWARMGVGCHYYCSYRKILLFITITAAAANGRGGGRIYSSDLLAAAAAIIFILIVIFISILIFILIFMFISLNLS